MSLRTRLIIAFLLLSVLPLSAVTFLSYLSSVHAFELAAQRAATQSAIDVSRRMEMITTDLGRRMDRHAATRRLQQLSATAGIRMPRMHPHMLRHTFVTTMLDAGVSLRDVQIAARHADPKTTMRYDRARKNLDRHPNYILAAYMAAGT